jgi:acyl carrier protein
VSPDETGDRIEAFIRGQFDVGMSDPRFRRDADLFEQGYVDSVGVAELVAFLEEEFGIEIPEEDLMSEEFSNIDGITRIVVRLADGPTDQSARNEERVVT